MLTTGCLTLTSWKTVMQPRLAPRVSPSVEVKRRVWHLLERSIPTLSMSFSMILWLLWTRTPPNTLLISVSADLF